jgi:hypothetical protein
MDTNMVIPTGKIDFCVIVLMIASDFKFCIHRAYSKVF